MTGTFALRPSVLQPTRTVVRVEVTPDVTPEGLRHWLFHRSVRMEFDCEGR